MFTSKRYRAGFIALMMTAILAMGASAMAADYVPVLVFGNSGTGDGQFKVPFSVTIDSSGNIYVADTNNYRIQKFSSAGVYQSQFGTQGTGDGQFTNPSGVAVDSFGYIFVLDSISVMSNRIQKFSGSLQYQSQFGTSGSGNGQFINAYGMEIDGSDNIWIADTENNRIQKFSNTGVYQTQFGSGGTGDGQFSFPRGVAVDSSGNIYVADTNNNRIQKFSSAGVYQTQFGSGGTGDGQFGFPRGVAVDSSGYIYVADTENDRIQKFSSAGVYQTQFGTSGSGNGQFNMPQKLKVDSSGNVFVADTFNNRIQKWAPVTRIINLSGNLSFGNVTVNSTKTATLTISNTGNSPLMVSSIIYPTAGGFTGNWSSGTIAAGGSQNVTITFEPMLVQPYSGTLTVVSDKTGGTDTMSVSGRGVAAASKLAVTGITNPIIGSTSDVTVTAQDSSGATVTDYTGTIHFTSSDTGATLPNDYTFVAADNGTHTFTGGVKFATAGNQTVTATDTTTATITGYQTVMLDCDVAPVITAPTSTTTTTGTAVTFTATGTNPTSTTWNFGDTASGSSNTATGTTVSHTFNTAGTYTVTLTATGTGCTKTATQTITVNPATHQTPTIANITPSSGPAAGGTPVTIAGTNFVAGTISVLFGGTAANCSNDTASPTTKLNCTTPDHAAGAVDVVVTVSGQSATKTGGFTYTETNACSALTADFTATPTTGLKPLTVNFDAGASAGAASYSWDFGDYGSTDNTAAGVTAGHIYASSGIYEVTLTITDSIGRYTATAKKQIIVMEIAGCTEPTTASFTATPITGNAPLTVSYNAAGSSDVTSYAWDFGDNQTGTGASGSHTYSKPGTYYMELKATGCTTVSDYKYITVTCDAEPTITSDKTSGNLPLMVTFTAGGTGTYPTWNFGDPASGSLNTGSGTSVSHTFNSSGYYDVTLTTTGYDNCTKSVTTRISVTCDAAPAITANPTSGNLPLTVTFTAGGTGTNPTWYFEDSASGSSNTASGTSASHTYNAAGRYYVSLTTTGTNSCTGYASTYITVSTYKTISLPSSLSFGNVYIGTNKQQTFNICNSGNAPLTVSSISYPAGFAGDWSGGTIAAGSYQNVKVTFIPAAAQSYSGTVTVFSDKTSGTNTMSISGTGVVLPSPYNAASEFSATNNSNGAWSYGYSHGRGGFDFDTYSSKLPANNSIDRWTPYSWDNYPAVMHNSASTDVTLFSSVLLKSGKILLHPGEGKNSVLRWTAPISGEIRIDAVFTGLDSSCPPSSDAAILHSSTELWNAGINTYNIPVSVSKSLTVNEGDTIDFTVGDGGNGYYNDWTGLDVSISYTLTGSEFTVSFQAGTGGTVSGTTLQTVSSGGSCSSVTAVPNSGYQFLSWSATSGFFSTANPLVVANVTGNMTITANFAPYYVQPEYPSDYCPDDPNKTEPGICDCGVPDTDTDKDGTPDCKDKCPNDPNKTEPGKCDCGVPDTDTDKDGTPDCLDKCPEDPKKTEPGKCGCGIPETETCGKCPEGSLKTEPGICGCNVADTDTDKDGIPDCNDKCPNDPKKTEPGICDCGIADTDSIGDGIADCLRADPPDPPVLLNPKLQAIITQGPVTLTASPFSAPGNQTHIETHWLIQRADRLYRAGNKALFDDHTVTFGNMTGFGFTEASPGLKYIWKAGYKGSGNSKISWSGESSFIVGTSEQSPVIEIPAGETAAQYRMFSIPYWMSNEDAAAVLGAAIGAYNTKMFRIGTFDADTGGYIEYGEGMKIIPGRAYWILARNGVKISISGVPVSLNHTIEVILNSGWNMVSAPNNADYDWDKVEVMVYDDNLNMIYGPAPVSAKNSQNYIETLWQWQNGDYTVADTLEKTKGYWLKAKQSGVVLKFPETAMGKSAARSEKRSSSAEKPPLPMDNTGFDVSTGSADAAGGCFINNAAQR